jgi:PAS domain S-box-containing protein
MFRRRSLLIKLLLLVGIPVLALAGLGTYGIANLRSTFADAENVQRASLEISLPLNQLRQSVLLMVIAPSDELQKELDNQQSALTATVEKTIHQWDAVEEGVSEREREAFGNLQTSWDAYKKSKDFTINRVRADYREEAFINALNTAPEQYGEVNQKLGEWTTAKVQAMRARYIRALWIYSLSIVLATVCVAGIGFVTTRSIFRPLALLKNAATRIASQADAASVDLALDERLEISSEDELGQLAGAFRQMVSTLRLAAERLSIEQRRTKAILDSTADGIITVSQEGKIRSFNAAVERLLGYSSDELLGQPIKNFLPSLGQDDATLKLAWNDADDRAGERSIEREMQARAKQGIEVPVALRVSQMEYMGERLLIATLQDITERKQAERQRQQVGEAIRDAVRRLSTTSRHILDATEHQLSGTRQQAAVVTQTLATTDEVANSAEQAAERADTVAQSALRADEVGRAGRAAIEKSRQSMDGVNEQVESIAQNILSLAERAQAIGEITATVKDIAEQTNVLALNAAVEASRAGEHGKGFAVVASEVKLLAEQAKKATSQVREILGEIQRATNNSVLATEQGTKAVADTSAIIQEAGETIASLSDTLANSARSAEQISASGRQQAASVAELNKGVHDIEEVAKQNVSAIQQIENAAKDLSGLSNELASLTSHESAV